MIALEVLPKVKRINDDAKLLLTIKLSYSTIPQINQLIFVLSCVDEEAEVFCLPLSSEN
ncbi:MAG: hypothetical protein KBD83_09035 [Gammaproteobacteria bacterium]|nr:hypothetical protein [Gammaproteobacteria bacterium]